MEFSLSEIQPLRKQLGKTQAELARLAGVSQSLIAKIESEKIDPTFSNAKKIFSALKKLMEKKEVLVSEIMNTQIILIGSEDTIGSAIKKMKSHEISQLPVTEGDNVIGMVSENVLLDALLNDSEKNEKISKIMEDSPPIINEDSPVKVASSLLRYYPMIIVRKNGKIAGLVTKSDIITKMYS